MQKGKLLFMDGMNIFIHNAYRDTKVSDEMCDKIISSMLKAVNLVIFEGGPTQMGQLSKLERKKFTNINKISDYVSKDLDYDREECKKVVSWMLEMMIRTKKQGGMSALVRMATLMRKGNEELKTGKTDYSDEVKDINKMLKDSDKK